MDYHQNYLALAHAIIKQAAEDWRTAWQKADERLQREVEKFFRSSWFAQLTDLDGEYLLQRLRQEAEVSRAKRFFVARKGKIYAMKPTEKKLYDFLKKHDGMTLFEEDIRKNISVSHGAFSEARKALVNAGIISAERKGKAVLYHILPKTSDEAKTSLLAQTSMETSGKTSLPKTSGKTSNPPENDGTIEPVTGNFADFDDWFLALIRAYGDVDVEEKGGGKYIVTLFEPFMAMKYQSNIDEEDNFCVELA